MASTADIAFARMAGIGPSPAELAKQAEVQRDIARAMVGVIADARYNPQALNGVEKATPIDAGKVETASETGVSEAGWYQPKPLDGPSQSQALIEQLVNSELPHGPASKAGK